MVGGGAGSVGVDAHAVQLEVSAGLDSGGQGVDVDLVLHFLDGGAIVAFGVARKVEEGGGGGGASASASGGRAGVGVCA